MSIALYSGSAHLPEGPPQKDPFSSLERMTHPWATAACLLEQAVQGKGGILQEGFFFPCCV